LNVSDECSAPNPPDTKGRRPYSVHLRGVVRTAFAITAAVRLDSSSTRATSLESGVRAGLEESRDEHDEDFGADHALAEQRDAPAELRMTLARGLLEVEQRRRAGEREPRSWA
jgi:hypothetical protein